jgi:PAS domain S-box-containing protein
MMADKPTYEELGQRVRKLEKAESGRSRAEKALQESEEKYRQLFNTVSDSVLVFDAETREFTDVNNAATTLYGYSKEEFFKLKHSDITCEPKKSDESIKQTISGEICRIPLRYHKKKDGTKFPVEISSGAFKLGNRQMVFHLQLPGQPLLQLPILFTSVAGQTCLFQLFRCFLNPN